MLVLQLRYFTALVSKVEQQVATRITGEQRHAHIHTYTHIHMHAHARIHTYTHVHTRAHKHEHIHAYLSASWFILGIEHLAPLPYSFPCSLLYFLSCSHTISSCFASRLCALNATQDKEAKEYLLANFVPALEVSCAYVCACVY